MKKILTDADGCLFDWETAFHQWMVEKGHSRTVANIYDIAETYAISTDQKRDLVREFNESAWVSNLPVFRDAVSGVARLVEAGYSFDCITSLSLDPYAKQLRWQNLRSAFGPDAFENLICLDTGADKDAALEFYSGSELWWIEDKPENCDAGLQAGLRPILIDHPHNSDYCNPAVTRVHTWAQLADLIIGEHNEQ